MTDLSNVAPELIQHLENLKQEDAHNAQNPTNETGRERAERVFPLRWGASDPIDQIYSKWIDYNGRDVEIRIYKPNNSCGTMVFLHGGGWQNGSIYTHDGSCILLANQARMAVVSVNYSKAPEHPFPAALNDGLAVIDWLLDQGTALGLDTNNILVGGESSGGNIAAVIAHHARAKNIALKGQMLIYPVVDARMNSQSYKTFETGFLLGAADIEGCLQAYLPDQKLRLNPDVSPLLSDDFSNLCPAFVATCDHDPLRDEGRAYAAKLITAGVDTEFIEFQGALHGIWIMKAITPLAEQIVKCAANWVLSLGLKN